MFWNEGLSPVCLAFCKGQILQLQQGTLPSFHTKNEAQINVLAVKKHRKDNVYFSSAFSGSCVVQLLLC